MTILSRVIPGAAIAALVAFTSFPESVDALATPNHNAVAHVARHGGISPVPATLHRKRNAHQYRKRCAVRPQSGSTTTAVTTTAAQVQTTTPPPPATTTQAQSNPNTPGYAGNGKVGIAWNDPADKFASFVTSKVGYYYTWSPWCFDASQAAGAKCAPMLWGWKQLEEFNQKVQPGYADVLLGPNEPDEHTQANMSPEDAANLWNQFIGPKRYQGYRLGSPAATGPGDRGINWQHAFRNLVGEKPDFYAIHWYDRGVDNFINYVTRYHNEMGNAKIWVTEYACQNFGGGEQCSEGEIWDFIAGTTGWMDSQWFVEAYFYFGTLSGMHNVNPLNQLMGYDGRPNDRGWSYLT